MATAVSARSEAATVTIESGQSLSGTLNLRGRTVCGLVMPGTWTPADVTFQASADGVTFGDVWAPDGSGSQVEVTHAVSASRFVSIGADPFAGATHIKVRSGTSATPVNQGAARTVTVLLREYW